MGQEKSRWEVIRLLDNRTPEGWGGTPHSIRLDGKEQYILPHLERNQAEQVERMLNSLNSIVASHATIS